MTGEISVAEAKDLLEKEDFVLLDVRTSEEHYADRIEPCVHMDLFDDFEKKIKELDKNKKYLVLCRSGNRSNTAAEILNEKGFEAFNIRGGILHW